MNTNFTKGEWKIEGNRIVSQINCHGTKSFKDVHIADASIGIADTPYIEVCQEEKANAKLIAAAPDLLKALNELYGAVNGNNNPPKYAIPFLESAKKAIKKATE